jgi:hypothetical protein
LRRLAKLFLDLIVLVGGKDTFEEEADGGLEEYGTFGGILDGVLVEDDNLDVDDLVELDSLFSGLVGLEFLRVESRLKAAAIWSMEIDRLNILTVYSDRSQRRKGYGQVTGGRR